MNNDLGNELVTVKDLDNLWEQVFMNFPLVVIGSKEIDGNFDLAPKHMAMPLSWENHFGFVCSSTHGTYQNIQHTGEFTVSYPRPDQVVMTSLTASPRCENQHKPVVEALPTFKASQIDGLFLKDAYLYLECKLDRIIDNFGKNSLITGTIIEAHIDKNIQRHSDRDDDELIHKNPILAYLYPGRFAKITESQILPVPSGYKR